jgi:hypothetical protein
MGRRSKSSPREITTFPIVPSDSEHETMSSAAVNVDGPAKSSSYYSAFTQRVSSGFSAVNSSISEAGKKVRRAAWPCAAAPARAPCFA